MSETLNFGAFFEGSNPVDHNESGGLVSTCIVVKCRWQAVRQQDENT